MKCPRCRLISPAEALCCDCGYDFASGMVKAPYARLAGKRVQPETSSKDSLYLAAVPAGTGLGSVGYMAMTAALSGRLDGWDMFNALVVGAPMGMIASGFLAVFAKALLAR